MWGGSGLLNLYDLRYLRQGSKIELAAKLGGCWFSLTEHLSIVACCVSRMAKCKLIGRFRFEKGARVKANAMPLAECVSVRLEVVVGDDLREPRIRRTAA